MAYGMVVYDENGDIQFNTEDPALYFDSNQVTETNFSLLNNVSMSSGTGSTYRQTITGQLAELVAARPTNGGGTVTSGAVGWTSFNTSNYFYGISLGTQINNITLSSNSAIQWYKLKTSGDLTPATTGYGMHLFDSNGNCTFTTNPTETSFSAWGSIVAIKPRGSSYSNITDPRGDVIYQSNAAEFPYLYVILNDHNFRFAYKRGLRSEQVGGPTDSLLNLTHRSYYFDASTYKIHAGNYVLNQFQPDGDTGILQTNFTLSAQSGTYGTDYMVIRAFQG